MNEPNSESRDALVMLAEDYMQEKKRRRRWGIFFKSVALLIFLSLAYQIAIEQVFTESAKDADHTALIDVKGPIVDSGLASADRVVGGLRAAFKNEHAKGIIIRINSPGGSAVMANYIFNEVTRLREKYPEKKVYAVCVDMCGSAGYYVAAAADFIYSDESSMVGSIGVLYNGFGFTGIMEKAGVERRLLAAGRYKSFMDPFSPRSEQQEAILTKMLENVQQEFVKKVKQGRGERLQEHPDLFTGLLWTGGEAKALGLIDGFGSTGSVAREQIKQEKLVNYSVRPTYLEQFAKQLGMAASAEWADRLGLTSGIILK